MRDYKENETRARSTQAWGRMMGPGATAAPTSGTPQRSLVGALGEDGQRGPQKPIPTLVSRKTCVQLNTNRTPYFCPGETRWA